LIFSQYWEFHFSVIGCILCAFMAYRRAPQARSSWQFWILLSVGLLVVMICVNFGARLLYERMSDKTLIAQGRNFYGVLSVRSEEVPGYGERYLLIHGQIAHGSQFRDADKRQLHTSYYSAESGVGKAIELHPRRAAGEKLRIGVVGLGIGTLASYGQPGDVVRFYELNPDVERIAREHFSYLADSPAQVDVALGDARVQLERELATGGSQQFDVLVIDAFSSDSIPMHLLTRECMALYWRHLKPDGILALHISSLFMDLRPVVHTLAEDAGYEPLLMRWDKPVENPHPAYSTSEWVLVTHSEAFLSDLKVQSQKRPWPESSAVPLVWTDDYGSLLQVLK
jgi:spermidine synthase